MKISKEFILREIAGEYILVPVGKAALEFSSMISVNEIGALIWKCLEKGSSVSEIVNVILNEYEIDEDTAKKDVEEFIQYLYQVKILE